MVDLKTDLLNQAYIDKNYQERELVRLAELPNSISYRTVVDDINYTLEKISLIEKRIELINRYFVVKQQTPPESGVTGTSQIPTV